MHIEPYWETLLLLNGDPQNLKFDDDMQRCVLKTHKGSPKMGALWNSGQDDGLQRRRYEASSQARTGMAKLAGVEFRFYAQCRGRWEALTAQEMLPLLSPSAHAASGMTRGHGREGECAGLDRSPLSEGVIRVQRTQTGRRCARAVEPAADGLDSWAARVPGRLRTLGAEPPTSR